MKKAILLALMGFLVISGHVPETRAADVSVGFSVGDRHHHGYRRGHRHRGRWYRSWRHCPYCRHRHWH